MDMIELKPTLAGGAGVASGVASGVHQQGFIHVIKLDYSAAPSTTDAIVRNSLGEVVLSVANISVSGIYYPRTPVHSSVGSGLFYESTNAVLDKFATYGPMSFSVLQADPASVVKATIYLCK